MPKTMNNNTERPQLKVRNVHFNFTNVRKHWMIQLQENKELSSLLRKQILESKKSLPVDFRNGKPHNRNLTAYCVSVQSLTNTPVA